MLSRYRIRMLLEHELPVTAGFVDYDFLHAAIPLQGLESCVPGPDK